MKTHIYFLTLSLFLMAQTITQAQEGTKIPFDEGVLKICSSKNFIIKGYDGKDVIIKNLNKDDKGNLLYGKASNLRNASSAYSYRVHAGDSNSFTPSRATTGKIRGVSTFPSRSANLRIPINGDSLNYNYLLFSNRNIEQSKGLKKLGKKAANKESGIYLKIEQKGNELIIKDDLENYLVMTSGEKYEITIPNSINLKWDTSGCTKTRSYFFSSNSSEIKNFKGEVEISSSLNNFNLVDVSGPVSINTIGGNVTVKFDKITPNKLYSIYSNNGFIDITIPKSSSLSIDATASEILSDLDFSILSEKDNIRTQQMNLKLGTGKVKMKLDADLGNIYLRKQ